jgi:predicted GH43/DUF377 family glycosyl hydrolase
MKRVVHCMILLVCQSAFAVDLEERIQSFVLETRQIKIPAFPHAFNPSIIRWRGSLLMTFRNIPNPNERYTSTIGIVWLDEDFYPISPPQLLDLGPTGIFAHVPSRAEDARLISVGDSLFLVYSDNRDPVISKGGFRVHVAELGFEEKRGRFFAKAISPLKHFEGESQNIREKNWVPFVFQQQLLLAYSLSPHKIFQPLLQESACMTQAISHREVPWRWGELRGGTPGLKVDENHYLAFFHSSKKMKTAHSGGQDILHYFMGAYLFTAIPPFELTQVSPEPIVGRGFYWGEVYKPYWHPVRSIFPGGFILDEDFVWIVYGRQDHEMWLIKLDRRGLLNSLVPVS